ncbi:MAG: hypothetical protein ACM3KR_08460 [Deltaproteobacteria bacterium]
MSNTGITLAVKITGYKKKGEAEPIKEIDVDIDILIPSKAVPSKSVEVIKETLVRKLPSIIMEKFSDEYRSFEVESFGAIVIHGAFARRKGGLEGSIPSVTLNN